MTHSFLNLPWLDSCLNLHDWHQTTRFYSVEHSALNPWRRTFWPAWHVTWRLWLGWTIMPRLVQVVKHYGKRQLSHTYVSICHPLSFTARMSCSLFQFCAFRFRPRSEIATCWPFFFEPLHDFLTDGFTTHTPTRSEGGGFLFRCQESALKHGWCFKKPTVSTRKIISSPFKGVL